MPAKESLKIPILRWFIYAQTPSNQVGLAVAAYLSPSTVVKAPTPHGVLVPWHQRTDVCGPTTASTSEPSSNYRSCAVIVRECTKANAAHDNGVAGTSCRRPIGIHPLTFISFSGHYGGGWRVSGHHENILWGKIEADAQGPTKGKDHNCPPLLFRVLGDCW